VQKFCGVLKAIRTWRLEFDDRASWLWRRSVFGQGSFWVFYLLLLMEIQNRKQPTLYRNFIFFCSAVIC